MHQSPVEDDNQEQAQALDQPTDAGQGSGDAPELVTEDLTKRKGVRGPVRVAVCSVAIVFA